MFLAVNNSKVDHSNLPRNCTFRESDWNILASFWHPVLFSSEVKDKPVAAKLLDVNLVVFRTSKGVHAAKDLCIHRGAALSLGCIKDDQLVCGFHGLHYNTEGQCTKIPSMTDQSKPIPKHLKLETYQVTERYGMIWVCLKSETIAPLPEWPELEQDAANWTTIELPVGTWNSTAARHVENFNDDAHLSWIHTDTFGNPSTPQIPDYQVEHLDNGIVHEIPYLEVFKKRDGTLIEAPMHYQLQINFPFISTLTTKHENKEIQYILHDVASPISAKESRIFQITSASDEFVDKEEYIKFQTAVNSEDIPFVESQRPEELPLDISEEIHFPADQMSIQYRKALIEQFGLGAPISA